MIITFGNLQQIFHKLDGVNVRGLRRSEYRAGRREGQKEDEECYGGSLGGRANTHSKITTHEKWVNASRYNHRTARG
jgi:hypothetical protein